MKQDNIWHKDHSETIDLRNQNTECPVWIPQYQGELKRQEKQGRLYQSGQQMQCLNDMIDAIEQAQQQIILISFLLAEQQLEDALIHAAERGVRVYILTASENRLANMPREEDEFGQKVLKQHKTMLNRLAGNVLLRSASNFHAKSLLTDVNNNTSQGFLLTANLTSDALKRNTELAIRLNQTEIQAAYQQLRWAFWEASEHELLEKGRLTTVKPLQRIEPPTKHPLFLATQPINSLEPLAQRLIINAKQHIIISSFGWELKQTVLQLLLQRIQEGIHVTLLCRIRPKVMPDLLKLAEAGANVYALPWLHAKAVWTDAGEAMIMSANFERQSFEDSFELGVFLQQQDAQDLKSILDSWISQAKYQLSVTPTFADLPVGELTAWQNGQLCDKQMDAKVSKDLGKVMADSADNLVTQRPSDKATLPWCYQIHYHWHTYAPHLNTKAKEIKQRQEKIVKEEIEVILKNKKNKPLKDKEGQIRKEKRIVEKTKIEHHSYHPPVYQQDQIKVVAIQTPQEISSAQRLIQQGIAEKMVVRK